MRCARLQPGKNSPIIKRMKWITTIVVLLLPLAVGASDGTAYRIVHPDGTVEFTDDPRRGGEPIELQEVPAVPAFVAPLTTRVESIPAPTQPQVKEVVPYRRLAISAPQADENLWFTGRGVDVMVNLEPGLQADHQIVIELDGEPVAHGQQTRFNLTDIPVGQRTLQSKVLDGQGKTLIRSEPVDFYFRRRARRD